MSDEHRAVQTPLVDLLRDVPIDHRTEWEIQWFEDGTPSGHALAPIGKHCHDAADRIDQLEQRIAELEARLTRSRAIVISLQRAGAKWNQAGRPRGTER